jgi:hypothetical protein
MRTRIGSLDCVVRLTKAWPMRQEGFRLATYWLWIIGIGIFHAVVWGNKLRISRREGLRDTNPQLYLSKWSIRNPLPQARDSVGLAEPGWDSDYPDRPLEEQP